MSSADHLSKQFGPRSDPSFCRAWSGSKLFNTLMVFLKGFFEEVDFEKNLQTTKKKNTCKITQYAKNAHKYLFSILCYWTVNNIILAVFYCHPGGFQTTFLWKNKNIIRSGITKRNVYNTVYHHLKYLTSESKVKIPCMASCEFLPLFMVYNLFLDNPCM